MPKYGDYDAATTLYGDEIFLVVQQDRDNTGAATGNPVTRNVTPNLLKTFLSSTAGNVTPYKYAASFQPGTLTMLGDKAITGVSAPGVKVGDTAIFVPMPTTTYPNGTPNGMFVKGCVVTSADTVTIMVSALAALTLGTTQIQGNVIVWR